MSTPEKEQSPVFRSAPLPESYYMGGHGDFIPVFGKSVVILDLHDDGTVTWREVDQ